MIASLCLGISLSAACGLRVFIPMVALSLAAKLGVVTPGAGWEWMGTWPAVLGFSGAAALEIAGFYIPWIDHLLDTLATPLAIITGGAAALATVGVIHGVPDSLTHAAALLGGGATAGVVQASTVTARAASTGLSGGLLNPLVSSVENALSAVLSFLAVVLPIIAGLVLVLVAALLVRSWMRQKRPVPAAA